MTNDNEPRTLAALITQLHTGDSLLPLLLADAMEDAGRDRDAELVRHVGFILEPFQASQKDLQASCVQPYRLRLLVGGYWTWEQLVPLPGHTQFGRECPLVVGPLDSDECIPWWGQQALVKDLFRTEDWELFTGLLLWVGWNLDLPHLETRERDNPTRERQADYVFLWRYLPPGITLADMSV